MAFVILNNFFEILFAKRHKNKIVEYFMPDFNFIQVCVKRARAETKTHTLGEFFLLHMYCVSFFDFPKCFDVGKLNVTVLDTVIIPRVEYSKQE